MLFKIPLVIQGLYDLLYSLLVIFLRGMYLSIMLLVDSRRLLKARFTSLSLAIFSISTAIKSNIKFSLSKLSIFRVYKLWCFGSLTELFFGIIKNDGRWSDIPVVMLPDTRSGLY